jgi:hypothetical protein
MELFMRRIIQLSVACLAAGAVSACSNPEQVKDTPDIPTAGVRFINAVPDTGGSGGLDFRFVDIVENNAQYAIPFRNTLTTSGAGAALIPASTQIEFKATQAGNRHFRIFLDDTLTTVAQTILKDSSMTVEAGHRYTVLLWGNSRTGVSPAMQLKIIDETYDPTANIGIRVINTTATALDVREYSYAGTLPASPTFAAVPGMSISNYINTAPDTMRFNVQPAGGGTPLFADVRALVGTKVGTVANGCTVGLDCDATPGSMAAGTALTAIIFPASVGGSRAPQSSAFKTPAISFMWDKRPPRAAGT